ncbi:phage major capsid protein [Nesterenkonia haasae]|uniref:phage major capsid protein n=1 Tax=Nesterenkonia haasae TaxID=2587813 RepID=UPI00139181A6|nr:phage major capsid protein [Nesterenkonia haasae]NDK33026.1 phage major capsid protein [Nesterenkonia haasae]
MNLKNESERYKMTPEEKLKDLEGEAKQLRIKANNNPRTFSEDDAERATEIAGEHARLREIVSRKKAAADALGPLAHVPSDEQSTLPEDEHQAYGQTSASRHRGNSPAREKATPFAQAIVKAFNAAGSIVGGPGSGKQLVESGRITAAIPSTAKSVPTSTNSGWGNAMTEGDLSWMVGLPRAGLSMLEIIQAEEVSSPVGAYLRQSQRENNASTVPGGQLKPISKYQLRPAQWRTSTIAHLSEPIRTQWLDDYSGLQDFISSELVHGVDRAANRFMLYGGQDEDGGSQPGLLNVGGVETTPYHTSKLRTLRAAIGDLEATGVQPTHIVMSPADWQEVELLEDSESRYLLSGAPGSRARKQLWGVPVITPPDMQDARAMVGTFENVRLLHRGSHQITWNDGWQAEDGDPNQPLDLYARNMVRFRDEIRVSLVIQSLQAYRYVLLHEEANEEPPEIPTPFPEVDYGNTSKLVPAPPRLDDLEDGDE